MKDFCRATPGTFASWEVAVVPKTSPVAEGKTRIGVLLPHLEPVFRGDIGAIAEYAQAVESLGFDHIKMGEHVLGTNAGSRPGWKGPYNHLDPFHDPFVLFAFLSARTTTLVFATSVVILPQRQTALVAKQAATLDLVSGGRLRLGVGVGWNAVEFDALGQDFSTRGRRCEEQIELMRALWTNELVTHHGRWDTVVDCGLNPLPVQRPIPIWIGGGPGAIWIGGRAGMSAGPAADGDRVLRRIARMADGWFPSLSLDTGAAEAISTLQGYILEEGRDVGDVGIEGSISLADSDPGEWALQAAQWKRAGATHLAVSSAGAGMTSVGQHVDALRQFREAVS